MAAEATAQRIVTRVSRQLETKVKKFGPAALAAVRSLALPGALALGVYAADRAFLSARNKALAKVVEQYRYTMASIPPAARAKNQLKMAKWLRTELDRIARQYDSRGIEERQGY